MRPDPAPPPAASPSALAQPALRPLLVANAITLFGSAFAFIPLGACFFRAFPDGVGFPAWLAVGFAIGSMARTIFGARGHRRAAYSRP